MRLIRQFIQDWIYTFALLMVVFIPFPFHMIPSLHLADSMFGGLIMYLDGMSGGIEIVNPGISSDSASMYLLVFILLVLACVITFIMSLTEIWNQNRDKIKPLFRSVFTFYLSLQLMKYGFDKIFGTQFYTPEPNVLYTPLGYLEKDILFWSTIGTSYLYSLVTGIAEAAAAFLILFRKTRTFGLLIACVALSQILLVNIAFDISVKLFSLFLLLLAIILIAPQARRIYNFLILQDMESLKREAETYKVFNHPFIRISLKTFVSGLIVLEALYPAFRNGSTHMVQEHELRGAYEILDVRSEQGSQIIEGKWPFKRFFIHRDGYIIFQDRYDHMVDYKLGTTAQRGKMIFSDYQRNVLRLDYKWTTPGRFIDLKFVNPEDAYIMKAKVLDWKAMPALRNNFHWTVDGAAGR